MSNKRKKRKNKKKFSFGKFIISIISLIIVFLCAMFCYYLVKEDFDYEKALYKWKNMVMLKPQKTTILLLGVSTDINTYLTDTIMVCSYNPDSQDAYLISIPRDTFIGDNKDSAKGTDKINSLYTRNGASEVEKKVEQITGLDIDYYIVVKNEALIEIVDSIGGIEFDVPIDMDYDDDSQNLHIHLNSGMQHIDGEKAEMLVRFRHNNDGSSYPANYGDNDFGRMKTQRAFITETAKQTLNAKNILKIHKVLGAVLKNVETDMNLITALKYVPSAFKFNTDSIESYVLPGESKKLNSLWFFEYNEIKTKELIESLE